MRQNCSSRQLMKGSSVNAVNNTWCTHNNLCTTYLKKKKNNLCTTNNLFFNSEIAFASIKLFTTWNYIKDHCWKVWLHMPAYPEDVPDIRRIFIFVLKKSSIFVSVSHTIRPSLSALKNASKNQKLSKQQFTCWLRSTPAIASIQCAHANNKRGTETK